MSLRPVPLPEGVQGALWLASMPGRFEPWPQFLAQAEKAALQRVVCLTPREEMAQLSPAYYAAVVNGRLPFRWQLLPLPNFGVPAEPPQFRDQIAQLAQGLRAGESVLLHCAAGMGRTGSAAACVLKALGLDTEQALARVQQAGSNPQNAAQAGFVEWF